MPAPRDILIAVMKQKDLNDADVASRVPFIRSATTVYRWREGRTRLDARKAGQVLAALGEDPESHGLPSAPEDEAPEWAQRLETKLDALIEYHRTGDAAKLDTP